MANDGGYASKVVAEYARLYQVAYGKTVPMRKPTVDVAESTSSRTKVPTTEMQPVVLPVMTPAKPATEAVIEKIAAL